MTGRYNPDEPGYRCIRCSQLCTRREAERGACDACRTRQRLAERAACAAGQHYWVGGYSPSTGRYEFCRQCYLGVPERARGAAS
jgi:hypothetical protein